MPVATLVPHVHPAPAAGLPAVRDRGAAAAHGAGRALWRQTDRLVARGLEQGRREYNECRARLGLGPLPYVHTGLSRALTLVATLPQLEYPRDWPAWLRVVGPLLWEPPGERVDPPPGDGPVVLVAPSTAQDPEHRLLRAALAGLAGERVRVIATFNGREPDPAGRRPGERRAGAVAVVLADDAGVRPGGGARRPRDVDARARRGCPVVVCPAGGDMAENAARVDWAGLGVRLPRRFCTPRGVRMAVRRALGRPALRARAAGVARWIAANDGGARAAEAIERWAAQPSRNALTASIRWSIALRTFGVAFRTGRPRAAPTCRPPRRRRGSPGGRRRGSRSTA